MKKRIIAFCLTFLALAFLCFALFFYYSDSYIRDQVNFTTYENLTEKNISFSDELALRKITTECFEEARRKNLLKFFSESQSLDSEYDERAIIEVLNKQLEKEAVSKVKYFSQTENATVVRYRDEPIGLYSCRDQDDFVENSVFIWNLCLTAPMRGKGIGHLIVENAIAHCKKSEKELFLTVYKDNLGAIALYRKHGFKAVEPETPFEEGFEFYNKILMKYSEK